MTIKQHGGIFGRNPTFNDVSAETLSIAGNAVPDASTILVDGDIGSTVQGYDADTAKYDDATANFTGTLQNGGSDVLVDTDVGSTVQGYDADTTKNDVSNTFTQPQVFPAGSNSAPAITTTGDTDTGIYFPAAGTIGLARNGDEVARVVSGGGVAFGSTGMPIYSSAIGDVGVKRLVVDQNLTSGNLGANVVTAAGFGGITASTGTLVFDIASVTAASPMGVLVKLSIDFRANSNTASNSPACEYIIRLFKANSRVVSMPSIQAVFEYNINQATALAFTNPSNDVGRITITNPKSVGLDGTYRLELLSYAAFWYLSSVSTT